MDSDGVAALRNQVCSLIFPIDSASSDWLQFIHSISYVKSWRRFNAHRSRSFIIFVVLPSFIFIRSLDVLWFAIRHIIPEFIAISKKSWFFLSNVIIMLDYLRIASIYIKTYLVHTLKPSEIIMVAQNIWQLDTVLPVREQTQRAHVSIWCIIEFTISSEQERGRERKKNGRNRYHNDGMNGK